MQYTFNYGNNFEASLDLNKAVTAGTLNNASAF